MTDEHRDDSKISMYLELHDYLERARDLIESRLIESGWRDQVRLVAKYAVEKGGDKTPTVDHLLKEVLPTARRIVPEAVKQELITELEAILIDIDKKTYETASENPLKMA